MKRVMFLAAVVLLSGCASKYNTEKITAYKMRIFGVIIGQNPATQTPELHLGFSSVVFQSIPISTNQIYSPNYADTFEIDQKGLSFNVVENTASGKASVGPGQNSTDIILKLKSLRGNPTNSVETRTGPP